MDELDETGGQPAGDAAAARATGKAGGAETAAGGAGAAGGVGDVETAGETTAAAAIKGPDDPRPVGADTLAQSVEDRGGD
jgi:hypothetical protein